MFYRVEREGILKILCGIFERKRLELIFAFISFITFSKHKTYFNSSRCNFISIQYHNQEKDL